MNLVGWLLVLAADGASAADRNRAAARAYENVASWMTPFLRGKGFKLGEDDRDDIVQHVLFRASTGSARFRGTTEGEAHAWCRRVAFNKAIDVVNQRRRESVEAPLDSSRPGVIASATHDAGESGGSVRGEAERVEALTEAIEESIRRTSRKNDAPSLVTSFRCHVDFRLGADIDNQIDTYGFGEEFAREPRSEESRLKARNRVYQWRKRGREVGCRALKALRAAGTGDESDLGLMARFLGCKDHDVAEKAEENGAKARVFS